MVNTSKYQTFAYCRAERNKFSFYPNINVSHPNQLGFC